MRTSHWLAVMVVAAGSVLRADDPEAGRGVARISVMAGDVSVRRGDSGDLVSAALNAPLVAGDRVLTGANSRAEVQLDYANIVRVAGDSEIRLSELENRRYQVQIAKGLATLRVLRDSDADVEISTPGVSVRPLRRGMYRIEVLADGQTEVAVRSGEVEIYTPRGSERIREGKAMVVRGTSSDAEFQVVRARPEDDWDRWNMNRDRDLERSSSYRYVSRDIYGAEDLDQHGSWVYDQPYGYVWTPRVAVGWAPYREGRWTWIDWYGWSWVSYDPWGWAPYHYGRWYYGGRGWCWYPGGISSRHYWSPGLVAFFGWGGHGGGGLGIGFGSVGWVPLAPYEPYYPWYGRGYYGGYRGNANNITVVNNVNIGNVYRNARGNHAITGLDGGDFARGRSGSAMRLDGEQFRQASLVRGQLPVAPHQESLRWSDREARNTQRASENDGRFFSRRQPAQVDRVPFEQQRQSIEQSTRRSFEPAGGVTPRVDRGEGVRVDRGGVDSSRRAEQPRIDRGGDVRATGRVERQDGWRRFGAPSDRTADRAPERNVDRGVDRAAERTVQRNDNSGVDRSSGWRRFGDPGTRDRSSEGSSAPSQRQVERAPRTPDSGFQRFENRPSDSGRSVSPRVERNDSSTVERQQRNTESPRFQRPQTQDRQESIRVSPPVVRERSAPRYEAPARTEAPRYQAPQGGGGGGSVQRGGGDGGRVQSGGGSHRGSDGGGHSGRGGRDR